MANLSSTRVRPSACLPGTTSCAALLKFAPPLLAALLLGCAGNVQHRSTNAQTELAKPKPAPVAAASPRQEPPSPQQPPRSPPEDEAPPTVFKDDSQAVAQDDASRPERFVDDTTGPQHEEEAPAQRFTDETSAAAEDQPPEQQTFADDDARGESESTSGAQRFTDDVGSAPEEDIVAAQPQFVDETAVADEGTPGLPQFSDDSAPATDEAAAPGSFADEGVQSGPEELVREPENFADDDKPTSAAEAKTTPATVLPMTITVEADPLFDFDQYSIRSESRNKLDELIQQLRGTAYGEVRMVGFADPIGSALYNQSLSERRAASVKQYLASKGIPVDRIRTEGRGETEEFATYKRCAGQSRQKLIACLQPDRRVEVTVTAGSQQ